VAANLGEGDISSYVSMTPSPNATVAITTTSGGTSLVSSTYTFLGGDQYSIFFTDNGSASSTTYTLAVLKDQSTSAPSGHSEFRFLNQAHSTGAVDIYMVPSTSTLVDSTPLITNLKVGNAVSYVSFLSQSVTMVIAATGTVFTTTNLTTAAYSSTSLTLSGGEVRTVLIVDNPLTSNPPVDVTIADDVN
jgi:hypothetical protein